MTDELQHKEQRCREMLRSLGSVLVAVSGGVDSSLLLALAVEALGAQNVQAATARGLLHPAGETLAAKALAEQLGAEWIEIDMADLADPRILDNPPDRCYWCKRLIFGRLVQLAQQRGLSAVASGSNADDDALHRPGARAEEELDIARPLRQAGLNKADIRALSLARGLASWNRPSRACLASRVPYGRALSEEVLRRIEAVESALEAMGFEQSRCRDHDTVARIEIPPEKLAKALASREAIVQAGRQAGYAYVTLDLQGFRSGSMDEAP